MTTDDAFIPHGYLHPQLRRRRARSRRAFGSHNSYRHSNFMTHPPQNSRFAMLADLAKETTSEGRRELLRKVTEALDPSTAMGAAEIAEFDEIVAAVASDFSAQIRAQIARLVASSLSPFSHTAHRLALDDIEVARPVLESSEALSE